MLEEFNLPKTLHYFCVAGFVDEDFCFVFIKQAEVVFAEREF